MEKNDEKPLKLSSTSTRIFVNEKEPIKVILAQYKKCNSVDQEMSGENFLIWKA